MPGSWHSEYGSYWFDDLGWSVGDYFSLLLRNHRKQRSGGQTFPFDLGYSLLLLSLVRLLVTSTNFSFKRNSFSNARWMGSEFLLYIQQRLSMPWTHLGLQTEPHIAPEMQRKVSIAIDLRCPVAQ